MGIMPRVQIPRRGPLLSIVPVVFDQAVPRRYSDLAGDNNPIHLDDVAAHRAGFSTVIVQGQCLLARALALIVDATGCNTIRRISCRFSGPVEVSEPVTIAIWRGVDPITLIFEMQTRRGTALKGGVVMNEPETEAEAAMGLATVRPQLASNGAAPCQRSVG
jgi:acyl dehydratase